MACAPYTYSPRGRGGLGVVQPQSGLDYPLLAPSEDIRYLIADFYLAYDDPGLYAEDVPVADHPLKIKWLYGVGCAQNSAPGWAPTPTHAADVLIVDSAGVTVFDSTTATRFTEKAWGADYHLYEWIKDTTVCRLVVYTTWAPDEAETRNYSLHITPQSAELDERAVYKMPKRVKSIKVLNTTVTANSANLLCGYNVGMETVANTERGIRHTNEITITAAPGLGVGRYSDCVEEPPPVVTINGARGSNVTLAATDCLWTRLDTVFNEDQTKLIAQKSTSVNPIKYPDGTTKLSIGSNCPACCDCDDYVNTGRYMNCVRDRYKLVGETSYGAMLQHVDNVARWVEQRECRIQKPLKVLMTPQKCPYIDVVVQYCNLCEQCAEDVNLIVDFSAYPSTTNVSVNVLHCYTIISAGTARNFPYYIPTVAPNNFAVNFGKVSAGNSADIKFRVEVVPALPLTITTTVTGTKKENGEVVIITAGCNPLGQQAVATTNAALACDNNGNTINACT